MKSILILFSVIFSTMLPAQAQFMDYRYSWTEAFTCFGSPSTNSYRYTFDSDSTEFNGAFYFQLLVSEEPAGDNFESTGKYIRNDDSSRVYIYENGFERLLYDFSLSVGDTFDTKNDWDCKLIIAAIDTIELLDGTQKKKFIFYFSGEEFYPEYIDSYPYWIEDIGNIYGLLGNDQMCQIDGCGSYFLCVNYLDTIIFQPGDSCWLLISRTIDLDFQSINTQPNPVSNTLQITDPAQIIDKIYLLDISGKIIGFPSDLTYDVSFLTSGLYFIRFDLKNRKQIFKHFIKI